MCDMKTQNARKYGIVEEEGHDQVYAHHRLAAGPGRQREKRYKERHAKRQSPICDDARLASNIVFAIGRITISGRDKGMGEGV